MDKLRAIKFFCRAAETKSFVAAAHDLDVVPSVLSKAISALEADIQFRLFNRSTRRVSLTDEGAHYYERCKRLIVELEETEVNSRQGTGRAGGRLLVGLHPAINRVLMARLSEFLIKYPDISLETTTSSLGTTLIEDRLDVLITLGDLPDSSLGIQRIGSTRFVLAASPKYLKQNGRPRSPPELAQHAITLSARRDGPSFAQWTLSRGAQTETVYVPARTICREGVHMHEACLGGAGISRMVEISIVPHLASGALETVLPEWAFGPLAINAVVPHSKNIPAKVRVFINFLRGVLSERAPRYDEIRGL